MKKLLFGLLAFTALVSFSCKHDNSDDVDATWDYSSENDMFVLDEDMFTISISGDLAGKSLYYAAVNTSDSEIEYEYVKYNTQNSRMLVSTQQDVVRADFNPVPLKQIKHFTGYNKKPLACPPATKAARTIDNPVSTAETDVTQLSITESSVGSLTKTLWLLQSEDEDSDTYTKEKATLWAYNDICNVWVADSDAYLTTDAAKKELATSYAQKFAAAYPIVRNVFGNESDKMYYSYNALTLRYTTAPMTYLSDTGTKVNIVIYDALGDKEEGQVMGFFNSMDYYPSTADFQKITGEDYDIKSYSNEGKYFYIDSYFATQDDYKDDAFSTLVHEFQHMINFGVKTMNGLQDDTNFMEMQAMLCEDMMQQHLDLSDEHAPRIRFQSFMIFYYECGIRQYNDSSDAYANAYAFGSWLARQYGGAALVKEMMTNQKTNNACIVAAVNTINGTSYTFSDLFAQFIKACYGTDSTYTFNQNAAQTLTYTSGSTTYSYPMTRINLWETGSIYDLSAITGETASGTTYTYKDLLLASIKNNTDLLAADYDYMGPARFSNGAITDLSASYGMFLKGKVGTFLEGDSDTYTLTFTTNSGSTKTGMKLYLYIK